jgi:hypothetical protein
MRTLYTTQFQVAPEEDQEKTFEAVDQLVEDWVQHGVSKRYHGGELDEVPRNGEVHPIEGYTVEGSFRGDPSETALRTVEYRHPDDEKDGIEWRTQIQLAIYAGIVEFNLVLRAGQSNYKLTSYSPDPGPPYIVRQVVEDFECVVGGRTLTREPRTLGENEVYEFVHDVLYSDARRLPIVLVTPEGQSGDELVDADRLAEFLTGLAEVYRVEGDFTTYHLSDILPPDFSTYNGAARIYWANLDREDSPYWHPLFTRDQILNWQDHGRDPYWEISQRVYSAAAELQQDGPVLERARSELLGQFRKKFEEAREKADSVEELNDQVDSLLDELKQKEKIIESLQEDKRELRRRFHEYQQRVAEDQPESMEAGVGLTDPDSVLDALHIAHNKHSDVLNVWSSAFESARDSQSDHSERVLETLEILAEVSKEYFEARRKGGGLGDNLENIFRKRRAPKYARTESETTMSQYGAARTFREDGVEHTFEKHFTIGVGSKKQCVQIYFEFHPDKDKTIIAYCGEHLPGEAWDS